MSKFNFNYSQISRQEVNGKRHYVTPDGLLPSVTTILSQTSTEDKSSGLERWRERIGHEEAERQTKHASDVGTVMHNTLEMNNDSRISHDFSEFTDEVYTEGVALSTRITENFGGKIKQVVGQEVALYHSENGQGYAGTTDLVAVIQDGGWTKLAICDYKNSRKAKREEWIEDYFMQLAAYIQAHNKMYGTSIKEGIIWMAGREDGSCQEFKIYGKRLEKYTRMWNQRVNQYFNSVSFTA